jgi:hypothetical protein
MLQLKGIVRLWCVSHNGIVGKAVHDNSHDKFTASEVPSILRQHSLIGFSNFKGGQDCSGSHPDRAECQVAARTSSKGIRGGDELALKVNTVN